LVVFAVLLSVWAIALLGAGVADTPVEFFGAVVVGTIAAAAWWYALRGSRFRRVLLWALAVLLATYGLAVLWAGIRFRSPGDLVLGTAVAIGAYLCTCAANTEDGRTPKSARNSG
jgi:hypothetical protein